MSELEKQIEGFNKRHADKIAGLALGELIEIDA